MDRAEEYRQFCATHPLQTYAIDGMRWEYVDTGMGAETLLLLPGGFGVADTSFRLVNAFKNDYRVVSLSYPPAITTFAGLVRGVAALIKAQDVAPAHVLGGSASGLIGQGLVRHHASLVRSLILSHTGVPQPERARWLVPTMALLAMLPFPLVQRFFHATVRAFLPGNDPEQRFWRSYFHQRIGELSPAALWSRFQVLIDIDRNVRFAPTPFQQPLLIIAAESDGFVGREQAALRQLYPNARYHVLAGGAHRNSVTAPEAEIAVIRHFLRAIG